MRWHLTCMLLLLAPLLGDAQPQDLDALLAFIEEHNGRLQAQRQVLTTLRAAAPGNAEVLSVLDADRRSVWKRTHVTAGVGERLSPGQDGSGLDARIGVTLTLPLADYSGRLAVARERQQQQEKQQTHQQQVEAAGLAYATLRAQIRTEVVAKLAHLEELRTTLAALHTQREARQAQQDLVAQRVEVGAEHRKELWQVQDQIRDLERQSALQEGKLQQGKMELAFYGGEKWKTVLEWLDARSSWLPSAAR